MVTADKLSKSCERALQPAMLRSPLYGTSGAEQTYLEKR